MQLPQARFPGNEMIRGFCTGSLLQGHAGPLLQGCEESGIGQEEKQNCGSVSVLGPIHGELQSWCVCVWPFTLIPAGSREA